MTSADTITIRPAVERDDWAIRRLAALDSQRPLTGNVLLAELEGQPVAAIDTAAGRVTADPFQQTDLIVTMLRAHSVAASRPRPAVPDQRTTRRLVLAR